MTVKAICVPDAKKIKKRCFAGESKKNDIDKNEKVFHNEIVVFQNERMCYES